MDERCREEPPPSVVLHRLLVGHWVSQALCVAAELGIADHMAGGSRDVSASRTPLRALARTVNSLDWAAWAELRHSVRTGDTAFRHVHHVGPFEYFRRNPEAGRIFDDAMTGFVTQNGAAIVEAYDFPNSSRVVDVGGGVGTLMLSILRANPTLTGVIFDLPEVVAAAGRRIQEAGLAARCDCVSGSFFDAVPTGGDVYVMASIIHDWDGADCRRILETCRAAMSPSAKRLLVEMVVPPGNDESFGKLLDLEMLVCFGGQERTEEEYRELLTASGFRVTRLVPTRTPSSIVEAVLC